MVNGGEVFFSTYKLPGSDFTTTFKGMLSVLVTFRVFTDIGRIARMGDLEKLEAVLSMATAVTDVANVVALKMRRLGKFLKIAGVALNGLSAIFNFLRMAEEFAEGDDAGIGYGMMGVGFAIFTGVGLYAQSVTAASGFAIVASAFWLAIGVALVAIGMILVMLLQDGPFEAWLKKTYFGIEWQNLDRNDQNFVDPSKNEDTFGYKDPLRIPILLTTDGIRAGNVNFLRKVSGLFSTARPIDVKQVAFGQETRDGEERWRAHIVIEPRHTQLLADGLLFLRPVKVYKKHAGPGLRGIGYADPVSDTCIHRFSLADRPGDATLQSKTDLRVAIPDLLAMFEDYDLNWALGAIEKHAEADFDSTGLELEIVDVNREENADGETAITKWEAKIWDTSGENMDRILGLPGQQLRVLAPTYYVELIYVPPKLARAIESQGAIWFRPEMLPTVSRELHAVRPPP